MLLEAGFVRELEALRRRMQVRARSGGGGEHIAKRRGSSAEFLEHRPYAPGDDLRRIDWLAFARTGEPVFKLFRAEEDIVVRLLVDASTSLAAGEPTKIETAKKLAAAIGYMGLASSERTQVAYGTERLERFGEPSRGRGGLPKLLKELDPIEADGKTDLAESIDQVIMRSPRPGMLVILSDFFDPGPFEAAVTKAASAGHDVALIQVLARDEVDPQYDGDYQLEDAETGDTVEVTMDAGAIEAYLARLNKLIFGLRALAKKTRATYVRHVTDEPVIGAIRRFVHRVVD
jgi:uncharacterized protein (DUF58 family)